MSSDLERAEALREVAGALAQARRWDDARAVAETIADPKERARALQAVAGALAWTGRWDDARAVAETIADPFWRAWALQAVAVTLINVGQIDNAAALLMRSWAQAQTVDELIKLFTIDASLLRAYPTLGSDLLEAFNWVERVVRAV